jgi:predicted DNA-binding transcriptional regulator AlpA
MSTINTTLDIGRCDVSVANGGRRLIDGRAAARKAGCSFRHWLRMCESGLAPRGYKLGFLRRWDETELDRWIAGGCKPVQRAEGVPA